MPAMPPTSAVPPLRTLRRVTVVMHSSLGVSELMPFGQCYAGFESVFSLSRLRARQRAIRWLDDHLLVFDSQRRGGEFAANQGEFFAEQQRDYIVPRNGYTAGPPAAWIAL